LYPENKGSESCLKGTCIIHSFPRSRVETQQTSHHAQEKHPLLLAEGRQVQRLAAFALDDIIHIDGLCPVRRVRNEPVDGSKDRLVHPPGFRMAAGGVFSDPRVDHYLLQSEAMGMDQEQEQELLNPKFSRRDALRLGAAGLASWLAGARRFIFLPVDRGLDRVPRFSRATPLPAISGRFGNSAAGRKRPGII
jgi:hypothetical protein